MTLALFDFDGTITRGDSFALFLKFVLGAKFYIRVLENLPSLALYKLGLRDNESTKQSVLNSCLGGLEVEILKSKCEAFCPSLLAFCKSSALERLEWHKAQGHKVILVSASFEEYLSPLCRMWQIELLATRMEAVDGRLTGRLASPNCYGPEKERRIRASYDLAAFESIYAYGDTRGDKEMLGLASPNQAFFRFFN